MARRSCPILELERLLHRYCADLLQQSQQIGLPTFFDELSAG